MKYLCLTLLFLCYSFVYAADASGNYAIWGVGKKSCIRYSDTRASSDADDYKQYVMGYLTAYNLMAEDTYRISGSKNLEDIMVWLDEYCELKAIHSFEQAMTEFIIESYDSRKKTAGSYKW